MRLLRIVNSRFWFLLALLTVALCMVALSTVATSARADAGEVLTFHTRRRVERAEAGGQFQIEYKTVEWAPQKTALVICDMWNTMCCKIPADRVAELAVRMNDVVKAARAKGVLIIHSPSGNVDFYDGTPQRKLVQAAPQVETEVPLEGWCYLNPQREAPLPIDDSEGGWEGPRLPGRPQTRQIETIQIEPPDAVGSSRDVFYLIQQRGIENVILMGVHANMCVLGRPFGIRQLVYQGKNVLLMRDMTDTMYNPQCWPRVRHVRGTELVVEHIEKYWCPTVTSTDLLDRPAFRFRQDDRPQVAFLVSDDHYDADKTLPAFGQMLREQYGYYVTVLHGEGKADIPGLAELETADCLVLFVRRLALPQRQLQRIRRYLDAGGSLVALRTASHAFVLRNGEPPQGSAQWASFDAEVLGGNYHDHLGNELGTDVAIVPEKSNHPILAGVAPPRWHSSGSLYRTSPIADNATVLMTGSAGGQSEPLTWIRRHKQGRVFYTGLGHPDDFSQPAFRTLLVNAIRWAIAPDASAGDIPGGVEKPPPDKL